MTVKQDGSQLSSSRDGEATSLRSGSTPMAQYGDVIGNSYIWPRCASDEDLDPGDVPRSPEPVSPTTEPMEADQQSDISATTETQPATSAPAPASGTPPYGPGNPRRSQRPRKAPKKLCLGIRHSPGVCPLAKRGGVASLFYKNTEQSILVY